LSSAARDQRKLIGALFDIASPADAPSAYYALYHDPARSTLYSRAGSNGDAIAYAGRFQTGIDLFRPLISMRCWNAEIAADLLAEALSVGRHYLFFANLNQLPMLGGSMAVSNERILCTYTLDPARFRSEINILVTTKLAPDGTPRAEISQQGYRAVAGLNWQSPGFAEIFVQTDPEVRGKGWGRSVAAAVTERVLKSGRLPVYLVERNNDASVALAESIGYTDTGARQVFAEVQYQGHPNAGKRS
jgi:ribosomal protein S18 acetylase RimI-like enzyme